MARMVPSPVIVRREGHNADRAANPIVRKAAVKERPVAAIMLDHEETDEQARRRHHQQQATPMAMNKNDPHHRPDDQKGPCRDHQFEHAAGIVGPAITGELLCQRAGFWLAFKHVWAAFEQCIQRTFTGGPSRTASRWLGSSVNACFGALLSNIAQSGIQVFTPNFSECEQY